MPWFDGVGGNPPPFNPDYVIEGVVPSQTFAATLALAIPNLLAVEVNVNAMLYGAFGLGPLQFDAKAQLDVALSASIGFNLAAALKANADIAAALSAGITPNFNLNAGIAADLQLKIGGIQLLLDLGLDLLFTIPPIVLGLQGFFNLPGAYFAIYYGNPANIRTWGDIQALVGGGNVAMMVMACGTNLIAKADFTAALGGIYTTSP